MANVIPVKAKYDVGGNAIALAELEAGDKIPAEYLGGSPTLEDAIFDSIQLTGGTGEQGTFRWNADEETVDLVQDGAVLQLGQELQVHCRNNSASPMTSGMAVMAVGTLGASGRILVAPMDASVPANAKMFIGIVTEAIAAGTDGKVTVFGKVRGFDTSAWADGSVLWCDQSTPGALTTVKPATGVALPVAFVVHSHATQGTLMVRTTNTSENIAISDIIGLTSALAGKVDTTDPRLSDARPASDVSAWAKEPIKPTYSKAEVGLSDVDNTSDVNKPVSTAQQAALDTKADKTITITAGAGLSGGGDLSGNRTLSVNYGTTAGTAAQGNDARLSDAREWTAPTVDQAEAEGGTATTRRAWTAQRVWQAASTAIAEWWSGITSVFGRTLVNVPDAAAGRTALGLGTIATQDASSVTVGTLSASGQIYSATNIAAVGEVTGLTVRASIANLITDWNAAVTTGDFMAFEGANAPTSYGWYIGRATAHNTGYVTQEAWLFTADNPVRFRRHSRDGVWSVWVHTGEWSSSGLAVAGVITAKGATSVDVNTAFESNALASGLTAYHAQNNGGYGAFFGYDNIRYSGGAAMVRNIANTPLVFETNNTECARFDQNGHLGLGVAPSAWAGFKAYQVIGGAIASGTGLYNNLLVASNAYYNGSGYTYIGNEPATLYRQLTGAHAWYSAPSGNAGDPISFTQAMTLFENGVFVVGEGNNSYHRINKPSSVADGTAIFEVSRFGTPGFAVFAVPGSYGSTAEAAAWVGASATTSRSINAVGTINASGADYAEYERNNGLVIGKGSVVGFKADGTLTLIYSEAIRFGIKSTNPSYVGGDVWGSEDQVGKRPDQPSYTAPTYTGPQAPVEPVKPAIQEGEEVNAEANNEAYLEALNAYQEQLTAYFDAQAAHKAAVEAAEAAHDEAMVQYEIDKAAFDERLEAARQTVDRIAYSGKVPVNVLGATPGGYIVATEGEAGEIVGEFVADPDFAQYKKAVGRVNRILEDGRCEVAVIVH